MFALIGFIVCLVAFRRNIVRLLPILYAYLLLWSSLRALEIGSYNTVYHHFEEKGLIWRVFVYEVVFLALLILFWRPTKLHTQMPKIPLLDTVIWIVLGICVYLSIGGVSPFVSKTTLSVVKTPLFEYSLVFIILLDHLGRKPSRFIRLSVFALLLVLTVVYFARIELMQFILYVIYSNRKAWIFRGRYIIPGIFTVLLLNSWYDLVRMNPMLIYDFSELMKLSISRLVFLDHFDQVNYSTVRIIGLKNYYPISYRLESFFSFVFASLFIETGASWNVAVLDKIKYPSGGGGFIGGYFDFWIGWLSLIVVPYLFYLLRKFRILNLLFFITFPRIIGYSPINFTKLFVFALIFILIYKLLINVVSSRS